MSSMKVRYESKGLNDAIDEYRAARAEGTAAALAFGDATRALEKAKMRVERAERDLHLWVEANDETRAKWDSEP